jgi:hypothetical protein
MPPSAPRRQSVFLRDQFGNLVVLVGDGVNQFRERGLGFPEFSAGISVMT